MMTPSFKDVHDAAYAGDMNLLRELFGQGANLNEFGEFGDSLLEEIVSNLCIDKKPYRYEVVQLLLEFGADPNLLDSERSGPLTPAMLAMDTSMLAILLESGADPNKHGGFVESETLYDWAEFDYRYEVFDINKLPEVPTEGDKRDEDSWLRFLDRIAEAAGERRPDHLFLLRQFGARTAHELAEDAGHAPV